MDAYRAMRSSIGLHEADEVRNTFELSTFTVKRCLRCMEAYSLYRLFLAKESVLLIAEKFDSSITTLIMIFAVNGFVAVFLQS